MKIRTGFVSNSSSSSFIVLLPHKPLHYIEVKNMLFKDYDENEVISIGLDLGEHGKMTVKQICEKVYQDILNGQDDRTDSVEDALRGYVQEIDERNHVCNAYRGIWEDLDKKTMDVYWKLQEKYGEDGVFDLDNKDLQEDKLYKKYLTSKQKSDAAEEDYHKERAKAVKELYNEFRERYKYHKFEAILEYGDRKGEHVLEYGHIFRNVPYMEISNH